MTDEIKTKLCVVGESGVGKTWIVKAKRGEELNEQERSTVGGVSSQINIEVGDKTVGFYVWDTAGQEKFRGLGKMFYKNCMVFIIVYDVTRIETFNLIDTVWLPNVKQYGEENPIVLLAGNKCDLIDEIEVEESVAKEYAKRIGAQLILTSAKNGEGIQELFEYAAKTLLEPINFSRWQNAQVSKESGANPNIVLKDDKGDKKKKKNCCNK